MRIAVYSGSFDPLHEGHLAILGILNARFDKVLLVVSPQNPLKSSDKALNSDSRLQAARLVLASAPSLDKVEVCDIEFSMPAPHYTYCTLNAIKERYPDAEISLAVGADNLECFQRWKNYSDILLEYGLIVFPRTGSDYIADRDRLLKENPSYRIELAEMELVNISSTQIREAAKRL